MWWWNVSNISTSSCIIHIFGNEIWEHNNISILLSLIWLHPHLFRYFTAAFSTALNLLLLRFGPRATGPSDDGSVASRPSEWAALIGNDIETGDKESKPSYGGTELDAHMSSQAKAVLSRPSTNLFPSSASTRSIGSRVNRPSLGVH